MKSSRHLAGDPHRMTPVAVIEAARATLGGIDLDPASSAFANRVVKAERFFSPKENGLKRPWEGRVWLNPPGGRAKMPNPFKTPSSAVLWWAKMMLERHRRNMGSGIFLGFSIEFLAAAQGLAPTFRQLKIKDSLPMDFPLCIPRTRIAFDSQQVDEEGKLFRRNDKGPTHSNVIVCVSHDSKVIKRFVKHHEPFGQVKI